MLLIASSARAHVRLAAVVLVAALWAFPARAQANPAPPPLPPYLAMVENWLGQEVKSARAAQSGCQATLDASRGLLDQARTARNATAISGAQRAVSVAEEALRKNRQREQRATRALTWVARLRDQKTPTGAVSGFLPRVDGKVEIEPAGGGAARAMTADTPPVLGPGDTIRTGPDGRADVLMPDGDLLSLDAGAALVLLDKATMALLYGEIRARIARNFARKFEVRTPTCAIAVRGTEFVVRTVPGKPASVVVVEGTVAFSDLSGAKTVLVGPGQQSYVLNDGSPAEPAKANLREMRRWWDE